MFAYLPFCLFFSTQPVTSLEKILGGGAIAALPAALKLDWNEGAIPPPPSVRDAMTRFIQSGDGALLKWYVKKNNVFPTMDLTHLIRK